MEVKLLAPKLETEAQKVKEEAAAKGGQKWTNDDSMRM
jgi:hypothetical protein